jgi:hypothetical protein
MAIVVGKTGAGFPGGGRTPPGEVLLTDYPANSAILFAWLIR